MTDKSGTITLLAVGAVVGLIGQQLIGRGLEAETTDAVAKRLSAFTADGRPLELKHLYNHMDWGKTPAGFWVFTLPLANLKDAPLLTVRIIPRDDGTVTLQWATIASTPVSLFLDNKLLAEIPPGVAGSIELMGSDLSPSTKFTTF